MSPAVRALPAALKRWLRPVRTDMARRPTRPRLMAAIVGVTMPAVRPCRSSARNTRPPLGMSARIRADAHSMLMPIAARARFHRSASTRAPPGIWPAGFTCLTWEKSRLSAASSVASVPPCSTLQRNAPPEPRPSEKPRASTSSRRFRRHPARARCNRRTTARLA
jgi:hypothetical protein